jgi:SAM-dependent methyltransferase
MDAAEWDDRYRTTELIWTAEPNRFLVEQVTDLGPGRALDLGCGEGRNAVWLAQRGFDVTAIDFSAVAIEKASQLAQERRVHVDWIVADVTATLPEGPFDLAVVLYLHLREPTFTSLLTRVCGALAPGGTLLVIGHHVDNLTDGVGGPQDRDVLHDHRVIAGSVAADPAMSVVTAARVERPVVVDDEQKYAIDSLVRATRVGVS